MLGPDKKILPAFLNSRYQILEKLGAGGMAVVFKAYDITLKRHVALKFLSTDHLGDELSKERFFREAQTVSGLNHPNICILHDIQEYHDIHFMVMELVEGQTLRALLRHSRTIPAKQVIHLITQIASALETAHDSGIIHRDIKPENIMITRDGHAKVMDFGLAKLSGSVPGANISDSNGDLLKSVSGLYGTDAYMSPEQIDNLPLDARTDIFSLGIIIYEMLKGKNPFYGKDSIALMKSILNDEPRLLETNSTGYPFELAKIVQKMLAKDPARRLQSMHELLDQLQKIQTTFPEKQPNRRLRTLGISLIMLSFCVLFIFMIRAFRHETKQDHLARSLRMYPVGVTSETEDFPSFFLNDEKIVYSSKSAGFRENDRSVWIKDLQTGRSEKLVHGAVSPDISPDGSKLVCSLKGGLVIFSILTDDSTLISTFGAHPQWSPDGKYIAFCTTGSHRAMEKNAIYIYSLEEGATRQISPNNGLQFSAPNWSTDGRRLVCIGGEGSSSDLWLIHFQTCKAKRLSHLKQWIKCPVFSPTGKFIYYLSSQNGSFDLWRTQINLARDELVGEPIQITLGLELMNLDISASGEKIIFSRNESKETIWRIPMRAGTNTSPDAVSILSNTQSTENLELSPDGNWMVLETSYAGLKSLLLKSMIDQTEKLLLQEMMAFSPSWSSDSRWIYFDAGGGHQADIWRIGTDGREPEKFLARPDAEWSPTCSPDGRNICLLSDRSGIFNLWLYDLQTGDNIQITNTPTTKTRGFWSHDSQRLAFFENCQDRDGCRILVHSLVNRHTEEVLFIPKRKITISNKLVWSASDETLYYLIRAYEPLYCVDLESKTAQPAFFFTEERLSPGSACVFDLENEHLYFVSSNTISDIWIAEGLE